MDIDPAIARALGFPKPQYTAVERERRWLCHEDFATREVTNEPQYTGGSLVKHGLPR